MKRYIITVFTVLFTVVNAPCQELFFEENDSTVTLYQYDQAIFTYQKSTNALNSKFPRSNYVHPLYDLKGNEITEDFPEDHYHHRGVFWTWHQLWQADKRLADPWLCENITWMVDSITTVVHENSATLKAMVYWIVPISGRLQKVIKENVIITYSRGQADFYTLDFDISMNALLDNISLGGSEDEKGYGGFSVRLKSDDDLKFSGTMGEITPQITAVAKDDEWVDMKFDQESGVIVMCNPRALPSFQGWILRTEKSMQNPAFPGRKTIKLKKDKTLHFENMLIIYNQPLKIRQIMDVYEQFIVGNNN